MAICDASWAVDEREGGRLLCRGVEGRLALVYAWAIEGLGLWDVAEGDRWMGWNAKGIPPIGIYMGICGVGGLCPSQYGTSRNPVVSLVSLPACGQVFQPAAINNSAISSRRTGTVPWASLAAYAYYEYEYNYPRTSTRYRGDPGN
eukprot:scaffold209704_cov46-Prasinocladus_malaysianus.AAC.1